MMGSNSQPLDYKPSALAIELYSSKAIAGKQLSLSSWCIASLYIFIIAQLWLTSLFLLSCIDQCLEHLVCNRGVVSLSPIIGKLPSFWQPHSTP